MIGYIYCYTNSFNNKKYIGQTTKTIEQQAGKDGSYYKKEWLFWRAIVKYGWNAFIPEILEIVEADTITDLRKCLNAREKYWITYYHTYINDNPCLGYNVSAGGGVNSCSAATRQKLSQAAKGRIPWNKGLTKEMDERLAKPNSGQWQRGHLNSPEAMQRAWAASTGEHSKVAKRVICVETGEIFISGAAAAKAYNINPTTISQCANGHIKTAGGLHWNFYVAKDTKSI